MDTHARLSELRSECADIMDKLPASLKPKDVLHFFKNVSFKTTGGQQVTASCMFCKRAITSTGAARLVDHLAECVVVLPEVKQKVKEIKSAQEKKRKMKQQESELLMKEADIQMELAKQQKLMQQGIRSSFRLVLISSHG